MNPDLIPTHASIAALALLTLSPIDCARNAGKYHMRFSQSRCIARSASA